MAELIYGELSYKIIGSIFTAYNSLGHGYQENYYQKAVAIELDKAKIQYTREKQTKLTYHDEIIGKYFLDFVIENKIVLELKVCNFFRVIDIKQILAYMKATGLKLGILILITNKGVKYKRIINSSR